MPPNSGGSRPASHLPRGQYLANTKRHLRSSAWFPPPGDAWARNLGATCTVGPKGFTKPLSEEDSLPKGTGDMRPQESRFGCSVCPMGGKEEARESELDSVLLPPGRLSRSRPSLGSVASSAVVAVTPSVQHRWRGCAPLARYAGRLVSAGDPQPGGPQPPRRPTARETRAAGRSAEGLRRSMTRGSGPPSPLRNREVGPRTAPGP